MTILLKPGRCLSVLPIILCTVWLLVTTFGCSKAFAAAAEEAAAAQGDDDNNNNQQQQQETFVVGGYLPDYRFSSNDDNDNLVDAAAPYLTDLILFSVQPTMLDNKNECCLQPSHYEIGRQSKSVQGSSIEKVWLTVGGGGGRSNDIPKILQDPIQTTDFIQSIARLAQKESIDGIDWNFYHPHYETLLLTFLQEASNFWRDQFGLKLSIALPAGIVLPSETYYTHVDRVNLMAYDIFDGTGQYHADIKQVKRAVKTLIRSGCPKSKIILGIPGYGRGLSNPNIVMSYGEIYDTQFLGTKQEIAQHRKTSSFVREDDDEGQMKMEWDCPNDVKDKTRWAVKEGLGGVFIWELGQDKFDFMEGTKKHWARGGILTQTMFLTAHLITTGNAPKVEL